MVGKVRQKVLSAIERLFSFLEKVETKGKAKIKQKGFVPVVRVFGFISAGILLIVMIAFIIFALTYRYSASDLRRAVSSLDSGYFQVSQYVQPFFLSIENTVESVVKSAAVLGIAFTFMLFLQITLLLFMLSTLKDTNRLSENNIVPEKVLEETANENSKLIKENNE